MNVGVLSRNNIFPLAWDAVANIDGFRWHDEAYKINSSQALAIDIFGCIQTSPNRDRILHELASQLGIPSFSPWNIEFEWKDPKNLLQEKRARTQVDVSLRNNESLIFAECKFTEPNITLCRQTVPFSQGRLKGLIQCNGRYETQTNPYNQITSQCALSGKQIRYWEIIDKIFDKKIYELEKCPFAGIWYQWMRNVTLGYAVAVDHGLTPSFSLVYADDPEFYTSHEINSKKWTKFHNLINKNAIKVNAVSYQEIISKIQAMNLSDHETWIDLEKWVTSKIGMSSIILKYRKSR